MPNQKISERANRGWGMLIYHRAFAMNLATSALIASAVLFLTGCKIVSIEKDREARERSSGTFDAAANVAGIWGTRIVPTLVASAVEITDLPRSEPDAFGKLHGRQAGEGSPWTFVLRGEGTVAAINRTSRQGEIAVALTGGGARQVLLQTGPVITQSALRDALPMFDFNDFSDQMAYAAVSRALNARALASVRPVAARLAPGARIRFIGVAHFTSDAEALRILPIRLEAVN